MQARFFQLYRSFPDDNRDVTRLQILYDWNVGISMFEVFSGKPLPQNYLTNFEMVCDMVGDLYDCLPGNFSWLIVSSKVVQCLRGINATGWFSHELGLEKQHPSLRGYTLLTSTYSSPSLDYERSELRWGDDRRGRYISTWGKLALTKEPKVDVFALQGLPFFLCASERVMDVWSDLGVTGIGYKPMGSPEI